MAHSDLHLSKALEARTPSAAQPRAPFRAWLVGPHQRSQVAGVVSARSGRRAVIFMALSLAWLSSACPLRGVFPGSRDADETEPRDEESAAPEPKEGSSLVELCDNGVSDDGDPFVDCDDRDCSASPVCTQSAQGRREICDNGVSDDDDAYIDCDDWDCDADPACVQPRREICDNGISDDGDPYVDCDDWDCDGAPSCGGSGLEHCSNGVSDDGDPFVDCDDFDCSNEPACQPSGGLDTESCTGTAGIVVPLSNATVAEVVVREGEFVVLLSRRGIALIGEGEEALLFELTFVPGVTSYPPETQAVRGGRIRWQGGRWIGVEPYVACEAAVESLTMSTDEETCDGVFDASFLCLGTGNAIVGASIVAPFASTGEAFDGNSSSCRSAGMPCSIGADCCSQSCFLAVGQCN